MESIEELMHEIAIHDNDPGYAKHIPHRSDKKASSIQHLRSRISRYNHTKEIVKLFLRQEIPPSFIKINNTSLLGLETAAQTHLTRTIGSINQAYISFLDTQSKLLSEKLSACLPNNWSFADVPKLAKRLYSLEQKHLDNYHTNLHLRNPSIGIVTSGPLIARIGLPQYRNEELTKQIDFLINRFTGSLQPHHITPFSGPVMEVPSPTKKEFILRRLSNGIYSIDKSTDPMKFETEILNALSLGLKFVPTSTLPYPLETLTSSFRDFNHKLNWKMFWSLKQQPTATRSILDLPPLRLRNKLPKTKPPTHKNLSAFVNSSYKTLLDSLIRANKQPFKPSTRDHQIKKMLVFFKKNSNDYLIKPADKGGAIVIIHTDFYRDSIEKMLKDSKTFFIPILSDPTTSLCKDVHQMVDQLYKTSLIDRRTRDMILPDEKSRCPSLYGLPKIHSPLMPFRPILSGNGHPTENSSILIDYILQPISTSHPLYLKDTTDLLNILSPHSFPKGSLLFTLDVVGMYTNIPISEALAAVKEAINTNRGLLTRGKTYYHPRAIMTLVDIVLNKNFFKFNNTFYHQKHGIAMGTPCACTVADLFICHFMIKAFKSCPFLPLIYKQYRDDGFGVWCHGPEELHKFVDTLNNLHPTIKFTMTTNPTVDYLDVTLNIGIDQKIQSQTYYKKTATFDYLHPDSNHPKHCKENITISQNIRHIRNCSQYSTYNHHIQLLKTKLIQKGYSLKLLEKKLKIHAYRDRAKLLKYKKLNQLERIPLVVTFDSKLPNIPNILKTNLETNELSKPNLDLIGGTPITGYKIQDSLGKKLIRAKFKKQLLL
jgi:hypothetical protein